METVVESIIESGSMPGGSSEGSTGEGRFKFSDGSGNVSIESSRPRKTLVILGGTGSLGRTLINRYYQHYKVVNFSRDECKHHLLRMTWKGAIESYSCDIANYTKLERGLIQYDPAIIIMAAAMKHIDTCERDSEASINTNIIGIKNVLDVVERNFKYRLQNIECVVMVSTDKACSPVNTYGICKALAEKMTIERSLRCPDIKWVVTRYGNVLNSRGSIIPFLHARGQSSEHKTLTLTDERMTRFIMTLEQSVDLIDYAIKKSLSGTITIPILPAMKILNLFELFAEKYQKKIVTIGVKKGEKIHEDLINDMEAEYARCVDNNGAQYIIVFPTFETYSKDTFPKYTKHRYSSSMNLMSKDSLKRIMELNQLI